MKKGFTLIELMVVVLIIGILAAVALPQYENSIKKSRTAEAIVMLKSIADAQQMYLTTFKKCSPFAAGGVTDVNGGLTELDVKIPAENLRGDSNDGKWHYKITSEAANAKNCIAQASNKKYFPNVSLQLKVFSDPYRMCWACEGTACDEFLILAGLQKKRC